jgi:hypothetical protein
MKENNIGSVSVHFEKQCEIIAEVDSKTPFVFKLAKSFHPLADQVGK